MLHAIADPAQRGDHSSESWASFVPYRPSWLMMSTSQIQCFCHIGVDLSLSMETICSLRAGLVCWVPQPRYGICFLYIRWLTSSLENSAPWPSMHLGPGLSLGGCATTCLDLAIKQSSNQVSKGLSAKQRPPGESSPLPTSFLWCAPLIPATSPACSCSCKWNEDGMNTRGYWEGENVLKSHMEPCKGCRVVCLLDMTTVVSELCTCVLEIGWKCHLPSHHLSWELVLCPTNTQC